MAQTITIRLDADAEHALDVLTQELSRSRIGG
jgi:predicted transcriptional regulator